MDKQDIIDGLDVILGRRGEKITQGDILIVEAAIMALARKGAAAPEAQAQITRITIPPKCNATGQIFMTMKLSAGEWYCHGCGANQSEPACRFRKSVPL